MTERVKVQEVFGVRSDLIIESYVERENIDDTLKDAIENSKKHIVIYGGTKQGKTSLLNKHIDSTSVIKVYPSVSTNSTDELYRSLLREVGAKIRTDHSESTSSSTSGKVVASFIKVFKGELSHKEDQGEKSNYVNVELNIANPQDVYGVLKDMEKEKSIVVIDNFHNLPNEIQIKFSKDLRTWNDLGLRFVILGIWKEQNYLTAYNTELLERIIEIPIEPWEMEDFENVISKGEVILNIQFSDELKNKILSMTYGSISILQELLKVSCLNAGIKEAPESKIEINNLEYVTKAIDKKVNDYRTNYINKLKLLAGANVTTQANSLYCYFYIAKFIFFNEDYSESGISKEVIYNFVRANINHTEVKDKVLRDTLSSQLNSLDKTLAKKNIHDLVTFNLGKLYFLDPLIKFYLFNCNKEEDFSYIPEPWIN